MTPRLRLLETFWRQKTLWSAPLRIQGAPWPPHLFLQSDSRLPAVAERGDQPSVLALMLLRQPRFYIEIEGHRP